MQITFEYEPDDYDMTEPHLSYVFGVEFDCKRFKDGDGASAVEPPSFTRLWLEELTVWMPPGDSGAKVGITDRLEKEVLDYCFRRCNGNTLRKKIEAKCVEYFEEHEYEEVA